MKKLLITSLVAYLIIYPQLGNAKNPSHGRHRYWNTIKNAHNSKKADLVISEIKKRGKVIIPKNKRGKIKVPIQITIKNQGKKVAQHFRIATEIFNNSVRHYSFIPLYTSSHPSSRPTIKINLSPGQSTKIYGQLTIPNNKRGRNIRIRAKVDDCSGEQFKHYYCRVRESNERNNYSGTIRIVIPK